MAQLISVGFGKVSFKRSNSSLSAMIVTPPFVREFPSKRFSRHGSLQKFAATDHPEINGSLFVDSLSDVPDGTVLLLQTSVRMGSVPIKDGAIFLVTRELGPLLSVSVSLFPASESKLGSSFLSFSGRADMLTAPKLHELGIVPYRSFVQTYMDEEEVQECFSYTILAEEKELPRAAVVVEKADGTKVSIPGRRSRVLNLKRDST